MGAVIRLDELRQTTSNYNNTKIYGHCSNKVDTKQAARSNSKALHIKMDWERWRDGKPQQQQPQQNGTLQVATEPKTRDMVRTKPQVYVGPMYVICM